MTGGEPVSRDARPHKKTRGIKSGDDWKYYWQAAPANNPRRGFTHPRVFSASIPLPS